MLPAPFLLSKLHSSYGRSPTCSRKPPATSRPAPAPGPAQSTFSSFAAFVTATLHLFLFDEHLLLDPGCELRRSLDFARQSLDPASVVRKHLLGGFTGWRKEPSHWWNLDSHGDREGVRDGPMTAEGL